MNPHILTIAISNGLLIGLGTIGLLRAAIAAFNKIANKMPAWQRDHVMHSTSRRVVIN